MILRMSFDPLPFDLELHYGYGLVHLGGQRVVYGVVDVSVQDVGPEFLAVIPCVDLFRKRCKGSQVDPVSHLQHVEVVVADIHPEKVGDAGPVSCGCAHPYHIVVAPLEVHIMEVHEEVHDPVWVRTSVEYVSDNVELIYGYPPDALRKFRYEVFAQAHLDD